MKHWLTTHYPHPVPDNHPWHIYLQGKHKGAVEGLTVADQVFFYEYRGQKPIKGSKRKHRIGRQGIVRAARVSGEMKHSDTRIEYTDGTIANWSWWIPTDDTDTNGFVPLEDLLPVIEYEPGSVLFGFNQGTGVMELCDSQANDLLKLFKANRSRP